MTSIGCCCGECNGLSGLPLRDCPSATTASGVGGVVLYLSHQHAGPYPEFACLMTHSYTRK